MVARITRNIHGFRELDLLLQKLPQRIENKVLQASTTAGARAMAKEVKAAAPVGAGKQSPASKQYKRLKQNIKVAPLRIARQKGRRGSRIYTGNAFWGMFLEFGTRFIAARPWFRPAIERSQGAGIKELREGIARGIDREARKLRGF